MMLTSSLQRHTSKNFPEEDDETVSLQDSADIMTDPANTHLCPTTADFASQVRVESRQFLDQEEEPRHSFGSAVPPNTLTAGCAPPTPFPSQTDRCGPRPSLVSGWSLYPDSLRSCQNHSFWTGSSGTYSTGTMLSLEQPLSLHSDPPSWDIGHQPSQHSGLHGPSPYACSPQSSPCWAQCCNDSLNRRVCGPAAVRHMHKPTLNPHFSGGGSGPSAVAAAIAGKAAHGCCRADEAAVIEKKNNSAPHSYKTLLSLEQRKVFVTYADDDEDHVKEVINFVALLRHNGFDTHIDIFEQQFRSISNIDFMERYLSEREFLIIIIISPKYHHTVTAPPVGVENDERMFNTVYIHKQLQNEFIQNGSKNFRFIPVLFPGAKQCHVPSWLQNTNVYRWPWDRDDILRRLMRVEKYNPPPIGTLPPILSIPL